MLDEKKTVELVAVFFAEHGRWPSAASPSSYERGAGVWLNEQRVADSTGTMDPFRKSFLDHHLPGWRSSAEDIWQERAREASDFVLCHGRLPDMGADTKGEQLIAIWLNSQRALERCGNLPTARRAWLNAHCPGWLGATESETVKRLNLGFGLKRPDGTTWNHSARADGFLQSSPN
ncbi:helicase associated domain-containing protein [Paenarthrobacter sp. YJN-5]|uniref:helicase associated domain-containing protein n=1 Tax=Paenarthrobacter sp. YJN-5 TaxID=2735316 RepID=UPI0018780ACC|nr:helicase associated domain-containing protein [Paenarthrobacter sp. YJN-5]